MTDHTPEQNDDRGPLTTYEITWMSGHVERVQAHSVMYPNTFSILGGPGGKQRVQFHGEIDGRWRLVLSALDEDIRTIRDCATERLGGGS